MVGVAAAAASPADLAAREQRQRAMAERSAAASAAKSAPKHTASSRPGAGGGARGGGGGYIGGGGGSGGAKAKAPVVQPDSDSIEFVQASELRKGNYIMINGRACRIADYSAYLSTRMQSLLSCDLDLIACVHS